MNKKLLLLISIGLVGQLAATLDPLSKIVVTSKKASCTQEKTGNRDTIFKYSENVVAVFADNSSIAADELEVFCNMRSRKNSEPAPLQKTSPLAASNIKMPSAPNAKDNQFSHFKKIIFKRNVQISREQLKAQADSALLMIPERVCRLHGNVRIWQKKNNPRDIPVTIESNDAIINLNTEQVHFTGSIEKPVSTVIELEGTPLLQKKSLLAANKNKDVRPTGKK